MQEQEFELQVGETLRVGEYTVTIVDVDAEEVSFRVDPNDESGEVRFENGAVTLDW